MSDHGPYSDLMLANYVNSYLRRPDMTRPAV
jgi:hypothetical protein